MNSNTQSLGNYFTTSRAYLGCVLGVDFNQCSTGSFRLVSQVIEELRPCCIVNELIENFGSVNHFAWLKLLNDNEAKGIHNITAEFVLKVCSLVTDFCVEFTKRLLGFAGSLFGVLSLKLFEFFFRMFQVLGVFNHITIGCGGKALDADIDTNLPVGSRKDARKYIVTGKAGIEAPILFLDRNSLDRALDFPVEFNSYGTDIHDVELAVFQLNAITIGWEGDRVEPVLAFESWKTGRVPYFYASKERLERFIELTKHILRTTTIKQSKLLVRTSNFFKGIGLVIIRDRLMPLPPAHDSLLKSAVVQEPGRVKEYGKFGILSGVGEQPVFERQFQLLTLL
jgi:hypothetical protein